MTRLVERLKARSLPSAFDFVGPKVEDLFDQGLRHKAGKKPYDYLRVWLSMLRPFAYATQDDSWGEMEKLLCIVMRNYVEMSRDTQEAAAAITDLEAQVKRLSADGIHTCSDQCTRVACVLRREKADLEALVGELGEALSSLLPDFTGGLDPTEPECVVIARATLAKLEKARGKDQEHG